MINYDTNPLYEKFNNATSRIKQIQEAGRKAAEKRQKEQEKRDAEKRELIKKATEDFSNEILGLVSDVLDTIKGRKGKIDYKILDKYESLRGIVSDDTLKENFHYFRELASQTKTGYRINDKGLSLILNYSTYCEHMSSVLCGGASFDDTSINYDYLAELLNPYSIFIEKVTRKYCNHSIGGDENIIFLEITALKSKELNQQPVKAYKNPKWDKYKDKHSY